LRGILEYVFQGLPETKVNQAIRDATDMTEFRVNAAFQVQPVVEESKDLQDRRVEMAQRGQKEVRDYQVCQVSTVLKVSQAFQVKRATSDPKVNRPPRFLV
jgi:hypothetical protein